MDLEWIFILENLHCNVYQIYQSPLYSLISRATIVYEIIEVGDSKDEFLVFCVMKCVKLDFSDYHYVLILCCTIVF